MPVTLSITASDDGQINVNGPLANKLQCYGMLACAADAIRDYNVQNQKLVQPATIVPVLDGGGLKR